MFSTRISINQIQFSFVTESRLNRKQKFEYRPPLTKTPVTRWATAWFV